MQTDAARGHRTVRAGALLSVMHLVPPRLEVRDESSGVPNSSRVENVSLKQRVQAGRSLVFPETQTEGFIGIGVR